MLIQKGHRRGPFLVKGRIDLGGMCAFKKNFTKKDGLSEDLVDSFLTNLDYSVLINTRGTTWRQLTDEQKANMDATKARNLMLNYDAIIKRPVWLFEDGTMAIGFAKKEQAAIAEKMHVNTLS